MLLNCWSSENVTCSNEVAVGTDVGYEDGGAEGLDVGYDNGFKDGCADGRAKGCFEGIKVGWLVGYDVGWDDGDLEGCPEGLPIGCELGWCEGAGQLRRTRGGGQRRCGGSYRRTIQKSHREPDAQWKPWTSRLNLVNNRNIPIGQSWRMKILIFIA